MTPDELVAAYPRLYHMAESGTWPSIKRHGLLSTSALLDALHIEGAARHQIESVRRPESVTIHGTMFGSIVIRDQKPLRVAALERCLEGVSPQAWLELLNRRVYFWVTESRLSSLLNARPYRNHDHTVLVVDTRALLGRHLERVRLSPINTGSTIRKPAPRGQWTFSSVANYPYQERLRARGRSDAVVELSVEYSVPEIARFVLQVSKRRGSEIKAILFDRDSRNGGEDCQAPGPTWRA
jgi:hypothetical protein